MQQAVTLTVRGLTMRGMMHLPEAAVSSAKPVPAAVLFHGFTSNKLEKHRMFWKLSRALEEQGIASFRFDFLGSGESDGDFEEMTVSGEIEEAHAVLDYVRSRPEIDAGRVMLLGMSMGGLVASVVAGERPQEVAKLALLCAAGDIKAVFGPQMAYYLKHPDLRVVDWDGNLVGRGFAEDVMALDPFERAKGYDGDVLLVHGTKDPTVPFETSEMYKARCYGERAVIHPIEGANHTFDKHEWEREVMERVTAFFKS